MTTLYSKNLNIRSTITHLAMTTQNLGENRPEAAGGAEGEVVTPQNGMSKPKFEVWTWGSFRRGYLKILHPKVINLFTENGGITTPRGPWEYKTSYERDLGFARILVENHDSRKNVEREVIFTSVKEPIVVCHYGAYSGSSHFSNIYLIKPDLSVEEIKDVKNEIEETENGNVIYVNNVTYVVVNNVKVIINKELVEKKYKAYKVKLETKNGKTYVKGDTYPIKDQLKQLGFRWDSLEKSWCVDDDINVRQLLAQIPNLQIEP